MARPGRSCHDKGTVSAVGRATRRVLPLSLCLLTLAAFLFLAASPATAGATFDAERVLKKTTPDQEQLEAEFPFTNTGTHPVSVVSVLSSCQCLVAEGPDKPVPPGGKGVVRGVFKMGAFNGIVEKQMTARIEEEGKITDTVLTVAVEMPQVFLIEPNTLTWTVGGAKEEQAFRVRVVWPEKMNLLKLECSREEFELRMETVEEGKEYKVFAKPRDLDGTPLLGLVQFKTDCRFEKFRNPMAFLSIRAKP